MKKFLIVPVVAAILAISLLMGGCVPLMIAGLLHRDYVSVKIDDAQYTIGNDYAMLEYFVFDEAGKNCIVPDTVGYRNKVYPVTGLRGNENDELVEGNGTVGELVIGKNVQHLNRYALRKQSDLYAVSVNDGNESYLSKDGVLYVKEGDELLLCFYPKGKKSETVTLSGDIDGVLPFSGFEENAYLQNLDVEPNDRLISVDGVLYADGGKELWLYPPQRQSEVFTVPDAVRSFNPNCGIWDNANLKRLQTDGDALTVQDGALLTADGEILLFRIGDGDCYAVPDGVRVVAANVFIGVKYAYLPADVKVLMDVYQGTLPELQAIYCEADVLPDFVEAADLNCKVMLGCARSDFEKFAQLVG